MLAHVLLFRQSGKYYTQEDWSIPPDAIGPYDMERSPDFRRISGGAVLVVEQEPWGYPHLCPAVVTLPTWQEALAEHIVAEMLELGEVVDAGDIAVALRGRAR